MFELYYNKFIILFFKFFNYRENRNCLYIVVIVKNFIKLYFISITNFEIINRYRMIFMKIINFAIIEKKNEKTIFIIYIKIIFFELKYV